MKSITIGKHVFKVLTKYTSDTGPIFYHTTFIEKREGGGWGIPVEIVYWVDDEILWFKKEVKIGEHEMFKLKVKIDKLAEILDMYLLANDIEY